MLMMTRRLLIAGLATLALAACETAVPIQRFPEITFAHLPKVGLNVTKIEVASEFRPTLQAPHIEHLMPSSPDKAMRRWAEDRLQAKGVTNVARFTINEATVTEAPLAVESGFKGAFKKQQAARYEAKVAATIEIVDERGFRRAFASSRVSRSQTLGEDASLNDRDRLWFELVDALMKDFNAEMEQDLRSHVGAFLM